MQSVLKLSYAAMVTGEKPGLRICKNCGKVYYNGHAKSEFCGTKCRNYYNVKLFRNRDEDGVVHILGVSTGLVPMEVFDERKHQINNLWEIFWTGGITNPLDVVEQMTYLMFIHDLDETRR